MPIRNFYTFILLFISANLFAQYDTTSFYQQGNPQGLEFSDISLPVGNYYGFQSFNNNTFSNSWSETYELPFYFEFFNQQVTHLKVSLNGLLTFDTLTTQLPNDNTNLPSDSLPNNTIAVYWDAFSNTPPLQPNIQLSEYGVAPNRTVWIKWNAHEIGTTNGRRVSFSVVLEENTGRIYLVDHTYAFSGLSNNTATVGLQKDNTTSIQFGDSLTNYINKSPLTHLDNNYIEFRPQKNNDVGAISYLSPVIPTSIGMSSIDVEIANHGLNTLTSATINWSINNIIQTPVSWSGNLAKDSIASVNLGNYNFTGGSYSLKFWTNNPNGQVDERPWNDTLTYEFCNSYGGNLIVGSSSNADFNSFKDACNQLNYCGIHAPVVLTLEPGVYDDGPFLLNNVSGANTINTITIDGVDKNTTKIAYKSTDTGFTTSIKPVLNISEMTDVFIKNLTVERTTTDGRWAGAAGIIIGSPIDINNNNVLIQNVIITTNETEYLRSHPSSTTYADVGAIKFYGDNVTIDSCEISGWNRGIIMQGDSVNITNNAILETPKGILCYNSNDFNIRSNTIICNKPKETDTNPFSQYFAVDVSDYSGRFEVSNNIIKTNDEGIYIKNANKWNITDSAKVYNNVIVNNNGMGIELSNADQMMVYHNSVKSKNSRAFSAYSLKSLQLYNNILYSEANRVVYINTASYTSIDYNLYYHNPSSTIPFFYNNSSFSSFSGWQSTQTWLNSNSMLGNPNFIDDELHIGVSPAIDAGITNLGITTDIDGDMRPSGNYPSSSIDIGADEFSPFNNDVALSKIETPSLNIVAGSQDVKVDITNLGIDTLQSTIIHWAIDGVLQTPFNWTGSLPIFQNNTSINIGTYNFPINFSELTTWTEFPNGVQDENTTNDTLVQTMCTGLEGVFSLGGSNADFETLTEAISALELCGVNDTVIIQFQPGTYDEYAIINEIPNTSFTRPVIFEGINQNDVILKGTGTPNYAILRINQADHLIFRNLTFDVTSTGSVGRGIWLENGADNIIVENNHFNAQGSLQKAIEAPYPISPNINGANHLTIKNNLFESRGWSIRIDAVDEYNPCIGNRIIDNTFIGSRNLAIVASEQDSFLISNNHFIETRTGILTNELSNSIIANNLIDNVERYALSTSVNPNGGTLDVYNNIGTCRDLAALTIEGDKLVNVYHNTFYSELSPALSIGNQSSTPYDLRNNIFVSNDTFVVESNPYITSSFTGLNMDYNIYYRKQGTGLFKMNSTIYPKLNDLKAILPTENDSSIVANPQFYSDADLHILIGPAMNKGDNSVNITTDIDGDTRPTAANPRVDIGADEHIPLNYDAGIVTLLSPIDEDCGSTSSDIIVVVRNFGASSFQNIPIDVNITGDATLSLSTTLSDTLFATEFDTIYLGSFDTYYGGVYNFEIIAHTNGDDNSTNDTLNVSKILKPTLELIMPNDTSFCAGTSNNIQLTASYPTGYSGNGIVWVSDLSDQAELTYNNTIALSGITEDTTVYAYGLGGKHYLGKMSSDSADDYQNSLSAGFKVYTAAILDSVTIYPQDTGQFIIEVYSFPASGGLPVFETKDTIHINSINNGQGVRIPVNVFLFASDDYYSLKISSNSGFFRETFLSPDSEIPTLGIVESWYHFAFNWTFTQLGCSVNPVNIGVDNPSIDSINVVDLSCFESGDGSINLEINNGLAPYSFNWSNGDITQNLIGIQSGNYLLTITDASGCTTQSNTITVQEPAEITITTDAINDVSCFGLQDGGVQLTTTGGTGSFTYLWNINAIIEDLQGVPAGTYSLTATDASGCTGSTSVTINEPDVLAIDDMTVQLTTQGGATGTATPSVIGGTPPYSYQWDVNAASQTTAQASFLSNGFYLVTVTDDRGCQTTDTAFVFTVNTNDLEIINSFKLYPNPTDKYLNLELEINESIDIQVEILDATGQQLVYREFENTNSITQYFDIQYLPSGLYLMKIQIGSDMMIKRIVVH